MARNEPEMLEAESAEALLRIERLTAAPVRTARPFMVERDAALAREAVLDAEQAALDAAEAERAAAWASGEFA